MIEPAKPCDVDALVEIGCAMHAESPRWRKLTYSEHKVRTMLQSLVESSDGLVLVARKEGQIIGGIVAIAASSWMSDDIIAKEIALFLLPQHRASFAACRLIAAMVAWSEIKGAKWLEAGISTGVLTERTAQLYERLGFTRFQIGLEYEQCVQDLS